MVIGSSFISAIGGYLWPLVPITFMVILLMVISGYFINGY
jgi:hypothetical protein